MSLYRSVIFIDSTSPRNQSTIKIVDLRDKPKKSTFMFIKDTDQETFVRTKLVYEHVSYLSRHSLVPLYAISVSLIKQTTPAIR